MAGRRLREAVKETLISNGNGEFDDDTHVVIAGLTNAYSQYVATLEEYEQQRYEVSTWKASFCLTILPKAGFCFITCSHVIFRLPQLSMDHTLYQHIFKSSRN